MAKGDDLQRQEVLKATGISCTRN